MIIARNANGNSNNTNSVLPVPTAARQPQAPKARLKLEIRRLPPGLTQEEFQNVLGEEWKVEGGRVDWIEYRGGKIKRYNRTLNPLERYGAY